MSENKAEDSKKPGCVVHIKGRMVLLITPPVLPETDEGLLKVIVKLGGPIGRALAVSLKEWRSAGLPHYQTPLAGADSNFHKMDHTLDDAMVASHKALKALEDARTKWEANRAHCKGFGLVPNPIEVIQDALDLLGPVLAMNQTATEDGNVFFEGSQSEAIANKVEQARKALKNRPSVHDERNRVVAALVKVGAPHSPAEIAAVMTNRYAVKMTPSAVSAAIQQIQRADENLPMERRQLPDLPLRKRKAAR